MRAAGLALVVAVALGTAGAPAASAAGTEPKAPETPEEWDERVLPFVKIVEKERGLRFDHPVEARFLADAEFLEALREDEEEPTAEDLAFEQHLAGELVAYGFAAEAVDLTDAYDDLDATGTVGFYDSETEELVVRGSDATTVDAKVTIVHELVHALQDQRFDIDALYEDTEEGSQELALDFLLEGDATTVENAYFETLSTEEQDEYFGTDEDPTVEPLPEDVPYALDIFGYAPYLLGEAYVYALDPKGGHKGRDRAFRDPPTTEEVLLDPVALRRDEEAEPVPDPVLEAGETKAYDPEQFGVLTLYLMLATRIDIRTALEAVTGWGGDRYVGFDRAGAACVRVNVTGDTARDTRQLERALREWGETMPAGAVDVSRADDVVTFTSCATPGVVEPTVERFDRAFSNVLGGRIYTVLGVATDGGIPLEDARCIGDRVSTDPEVMGIYDDLAAERRDITDDEQDVVDESFERAGPACFLAP